MRACARERVGVSMLAVARLHANERTRGGDGRLWKVRKCVSEFGEEFVPGIESVCTSVIILIYLRHDSNC